MFNETIIKEAIRHELTVLDLRILCGRAEDYAAVSPIEPAELGAGKIEKLIWAMASGKGGGRAVTVHC